MNEQKTKPRILISLNNGWVIRNWIYTGILDDLAEKFDVMVLTPVKDDPEFRDVLSKRKLSIKVSLLHELETNPFIKMIRGIKDKLFYEIHGLETQKIQRFDRRYNLFLKGASLFILVLSKLPWSNWFIHLLERLDNFLNRKKIYIETLNNFNPDLFVSTHPFGEIERKIIIEASREKIPVLASLLSWDNIFNKGMLPLFFNKIIVWSQIQEDRILSYYPEYNSKHIAISGIPNFDIYRSKESEDFNRQDYLKSINIDPEYRVLLYCTGPPSLFPKESEIVDILIKNMDRGAFPENTHLLVRLHPHDDYERYELFLNHKKVTIFNSSLDKQSRDTFTWIPPEDEMFGLMAMLKSSDLCINIASTTSLDAAACEIPIINVAFDGYKDEKYFGSARRFYDFTHYKDVVKTGAVKLVYNEKELIHGINHYLKSPSSDKEKRDKLVSEQCWKVDGKSSERVVKIISDFIAELQ